jgi:hypothetical protein
VRYYSLHHEERGPDVNVKYGCIAFRCGFGDWIGSEDASIVDQNVDAVTESFNSGSYYLLWRIDLREVSLDDYCVAAIVEGFDVVCNFLCELSTPGRRVAECDLVFLSG